MSGVGTCQVVNALAATDFESPSTVDKSGWLATTYNSQTGKWLVEVNVDAMPAGGLVMAPSNEGQWDSQAELAQYISELLEIPIDNDTGWLEPFDYRQIGLVAAYFRVANKLMRSDSLYRVIVQDTSGIVYVDGQPVNNNFHEECRSPLAMIERCEQAAHPQGVCESRVDGMSPGGLGVVSQSRLQIWESALTNVETGCARNSLFELTVDGALLVSEPEELEQAQETNPMVCDFGVSPPSCRFRTISEMIPPQGIVFPDPNYLPNLDIRLTRVRGNMEMIPSYYVGDTLLVQDEIQVNDAMGLRVDWRSGDSQPMTATCSYSVVERDTDRLDLENGVADDRALSKPMCAL